MRRDPRATRRLGRREPLSADRRHRPGRGDLRSARRGAARAARGGRGRGGGALVRCGLSPGAGRAARRVGQRSAGPARRRRDARRRRLRVCVRPVAADAVPARGRRPHPPDAAGGAALRRPGRRPALRHRAAAGVDRLRGRRLRHSRRGHARLQDRHRRAWPGHRSRHRRPGRERRTPSRRRAPFSRGDFRRSCTRRWSTGTSASTENTSSGDFIIDRHPQWAHVWIAGGGSGHGFKHGPAVGKHVTDLLDGRAEVEPRFALAGKSVEAARAVY